MASSSQPCLWIRASPRGTRSGFAVLSDGSGGQLTVTVLPKPWVANAGVVHEVWHRAGMTTHLVMYEAELAAVFAPASAVGAFAMGLSDSGRDQAHLLGLGSPSNDPRTLVTTSVDPFSDLIDLMLLAERGRVTASPLEFDGSFVPSLLRLFTHERLLRTVERLIFRARPRYVQRTEVLEVPRGRLSARSLRVCCRFG